MTIKRKDNLHINVPAGHSWLDVEEVLIKYSLCAQRSNKNDIYIYFLILQSKDKILVKILSQYCCSSPHQDDD